MLPRKLQDHDFRALLRHCPPSRTAAFEAVVAALAARAPPRCSICGAKGVPAALNDGDDSPSGGSDDNTSGRQKRGGSRKEKLHFTTLWELNFEERAAKLQPPGFCCSLCRACLDLGAVLQLAALRSVTSSGQSGCALPPVGQCSGSRAHICQLVAWSWPR